MPDPNEVITQLLSASQADALDRVGSEVWGAASGALQTLLGGLPGFTGVNGRLVMPEEIASDFGAPHLVAPLEISTARDQTAFGYLIVPTAEAAVFFDSQADVFDDQEQQTIVVASTILGQVIQALNSRVFGDSPVGLVVSLDDVVANTMPALLPTLDEPGLLLTGTLHGAHPLPLTLFMPGTFLDIVAGALPERPAGSDPDAMPFTLTDDDLEAADLIEDIPAVNPEPAPEPMLAGVGTHSRTDDSPSPFREPTPISQAPAAARARFAPLAEPGPSSTFNPIDLLAGLQMNVTVELGRTDLTVAEVLALGPGSVIELERLAGEPVDILVNDRLIARGEVVVVDENFGVRVVEVLRRGPEGEER